MDQRHRESTDSSSNLVDASRWPVVRALDDLLARSRRERTDMLNNRRSQLIPTPDSSSSLGKAGPRPGGELESSAFPLAQQPTSSGPPFYPRDTPALGNNFRPVSVASIPSLPPRLSVIPSKRPASPGDIPRRPPRLLLPRLPSDLQSALNWCFPLRGQNYRRILVRCLCRLFLAGRLVVQVAELEHVSRAQHENSKEGLATLLEFSQTTSIVQLLEKAESDGLLHFVGKNKGRVKLSKDCTPLGLLYRPFITALRYILVHDHVFEVSQRTICEVMQSTTLKWPLYEEFCGHRATKHMLAAAASGLVTLNNRSMTIALAAEWRYSGRRSGSTVVEEKKHGANFATHVYLQQEEETIRRVLSCYGDQLDALQTAELDRAKTVFKLLITILQAHLSEDHPDVSTSIIARELKLPDESFKQYAGTLGFVLYISSAIDAGLVSEVGTGSEARVTLTGWKKCGIMKRFWDAKGAWQELEEKRRWWEAFQKLPVDDPHAPI